MEGEGRGGEGRREGEAAITKRKLQVPYLENKYSVGTMHCCTFA